VIQTRLGHASAKTTLDVYGHLFPDEQDRTRAAVDAALIAADLAPRQLASEWPAAADHSGSCVKTVSRRAGAAAKPQVKG